MRQRPYAAVPTDMVGQVRTFRAPEIPIGLLDGDWSETGEISGLEGWSINRGLDGEIAICAPGCNPGSTTLGPNERSLAGRLLYKLASDLLDAEEARRAI